MCACLAVLVVAVAAAGWAYVNYRYGQIHKVKVPGLAAPGKGPGSSGRNGPPINVLLVGSNTRAGLRPDEAKAFGTPQEVGGARSDVTMVIRLDPRSGAVSLLSIPRDLFLPVPGTDQMQRVDAALNQGPGQLASVIQADLGIPINHYVELNFDTFQSVVDVVGGVDMYFPTDVKDSYTGLAQGPGCRHLNGSQALEVVRARHMYYRDRDGAWAYDGNGDLSRIRRNHEFLKAVGHRISSNGLDNPLTANQLVAKLAPNLTIDSGFTLSDLFDVLRRFHSVDAATIPTLTLPVLEVNNYYLRGYNFGDVVFPSQPQDQQVIDQFLGVAAPPNANLPAAAISVSVIDAIGNERAASQATSQLQTLGFEATGPTTRLVPAPIVETTITYSPGKLPAAQRLAANVNGPVSLGPNSTPLGTDLVLTLGNGATITQPPPPAPAAGAPVAPPTTSATTQETNVAGLPVTTVDNQPTWFDPTTCPSQ